MIKTKFKRILKIPKTKNLFANLALATPKLNVTGTSSMVRKEFYVQTVLFSYIKNVVELP